MNNERKYTLTDTLRHTAEHYPDRTAIYFEDQAITYGQLDEKVSRFASGLLKMGIEKGDRVGLYMPNYPEWVIAFFGISRMGGVVVPMNTRYKDNEVKYIMNNSEATCLVMTSDFLNIDYVDILDSLKGRIPSLRKIIVLGEKLSPNMDRFNDVLEAGRDFKEHDEQTSISESIAPDDVVFILYTSGTTGEPKGAMLSNLNITKNAEQVADVMKQNEEDVALIVVPFFHCFGCVIGISACVSKGSGMVPMPSYNAENALEIMERHGISIVHGVPTMFIGYLEILGKRSFDLDRVRTGVMAGAPCPVEVMKGASEKMGANIVIAYGLTETSPVITMTELDDTLEDRVETVGRALLEQEVRIVDDGHEPVSHGSTGELIVRGYNVMKGYYKKPDETARTIDEEGWLYSGDLATMDERGYIRIVGRKKEMYISGGFNVYPREIEEYLFTHPKVENVAVLGIPDKRFGEVGLAVIKLKKGEDSTKGEIIEFCRERIANFKVPKYVWFVEGYPMTQSGKIQKFKLREIALDLFASNS